MSAMHPRGVILGAQRRVRRLRDSLTPGRADPRQAERAQRRTERERERERERGGTAAGRGKVL